MRRYRPTLNGVAREDFSEERTCKQKLNEVKKQAEGYLVEGYSSTEERRREPDGRSMPAMFKQNLGCPCS